MTSNAKDLTQEAAVSPSDRVGGYVILARAADKCRAKFLGGKLGEYHIDCPLDNMLLGFKGIPYADFQKEVETGATDEQLAQYLDAHGTPKTKEEVEAWSDKMDEANPYNDPSRRDWFAGECAKLDLDPATTTLFEWLDADDEASF